MGGGLSLNINKVEAWQQMKESLQIYAAEVNENRALPAIEDGLKPSGRQLLYCLYKNKFFSNKPYTKSANAVGLTMAAYYPHGNQALEGVLANLAMGWKNNAPLIDFHGGLGTVDNPTGTASARYTECRLSQYAEQLIGDLKNELPEQYWEENYLQTELIPKYFPGNFPNLLVNENIGIGWACAAGWLPHDLQDVIKLIHQFMETGEVMQIHPSFPSGGIILNGSDLPQIYASGKGTIFMSSKYKIVGNTITITELPYKVGPKKILQQVDKAKDAGMAWAKNIVEIYDNSSMGKTELVIKQRVLDVDALLKNTSMTSNYSVNMTALVNGKPKQLSLREVLQHYTTNQHNRLTYKANCTKNAAEAKCHVLEGFIKILSDLDKALEIIKTSPNKAEAADRLKAEFAIDADQAEYILSLKLSQITKRGIEDIQKEIAELNNLILEQENIINDKSLRTQMIITELKAIPCKKSPETTVEMNSFINNPEIVSNTLTMSNGDTITVSGTDQVLVVTTDGRGYRFKGTQLNKIPSNILFMHTADWVNKQKMIKIGNEILHPSIVSFRCKSSRGAKFPLK